MTGSGLTSCVNHAHSYHMATKRFDKRLHILVTASEQEMLSMLAEREGLSPSDMVRQLVRRAHARAFGESAVVRQKVTKRRK